MPHRVAVRARGWARRETAASDRRQAPRGVDPSGDVIGTMFTNNALLPGAFEQLEWVVGAPAEVAKTFYASVDETGAGAGPIAECDEGNNGGTTTTVACPTPG
jgi:hypothetical protein